LSPGGRYVATGCVDGRVRVFALPGGRLVTQFVQRGSVSAASFSQDGRYAVTACKGTARVFAAESGKLLAVLPVNGFPRDVALDSRGRYLSILTHVAEHAAMQVFNTTTRVGMEWPALRQAEFSYGVASAFSPAEHSLAVLGPDHVIRILDLKDGKVRQLGRTPLQLSRHFLEGPLLLRGGIAFIPGGDYVAATGLDDTVSVFTVKSGEEVLKLLDEDIADIHIPGRDQAYSRALLPQMKPKAPSWQPVTFALSSDGRWLFVAMRFWEEGTSHRSGLHLRDEEILVSRYLVRAEDVVAGACTRVERNLTPKEWKEYLGNEPYRKTCPNLP